MQQNTHIIVSIVPALFGGMGHVYGYHKAVGEAARINGWQHYVATSPDPIIKSLPDRWIACLNNGDLELSFKQRKARFLLPSVLNDILTLSYTLTPFIRDLLAMKDQEECLTIFFERFNAMQLLSLFLTICRIKRKNVSCWLLFRHEPSFFGRSGGVYRFIAYALSVWLGSKHFKLLADSDPLCESVSKYFNQPVFVVPIPHTHNTADISLFNADDEVVLWWPGSPRLNKGWDIIKNIAMVRRSDHPLKRPIRLLISEAAEINESIPSITLQLVNNVLPEEDYQRYISSVDVVLLPYDPNLYRASTSGIFTEVVFAGGMPVVTDDTWMAFELKKFNLSELVIEWEDPEILNNILSLASSIEVAQKLKVMREHYLRFHSVESFAQRIDKLHRDAI